VTLTTPLLASGSVCRLDRRALLSAMPMLHLAGLPACHTYIIGNTTTCQHKKVTGPTHLCIGGAGGGKPMR
jgi:hypothetical protein